MLASERHGHGEPLVLLHGLTHRRQAWYPVLDRLAAEREVVLVDLPGHGASPDLPADGRSVTEVMRDEFAAFFADQGLDRPHLAGNSLGGYLALIAGAEGAARSVTALSPAGFWRTSAQFAYSRRLFLSAGAASARVGARFELLARTAAGRKAMYAVLCAHPARVSRDQAIGDARGFRRAQPALGPLLAAAAPFDREIPDDVRVTIAWGARDLLLPPWQARVAEQALPLARHLMLGGVGHVPMTDDPGRVTQVLLDGSAPVAAEPVAPTALTA